VFLPINLSKTYDMPTLEANLRKFVSLDL